MGQNSCQPEGLQPESALASLLVLAIERLLPSPGALPSPILAATHTCFIMLWAPGKGSFPPVSCQLSYYAQCIFHPPFAAKQLPLGNKGRTEVGMGRNLRVAKPIPLPAPP